MLLEAGSRIGAYEIVAALGSGGMGEVYRARDPKLRRDVAIKILPHIFAQDPDRVSRFQREAQVLASLNHPNIAQIYGLDDSAGLHALVLELVEGPTLEDRIARGALNWTDGVPIARQIAEALEAAHEHGIVHRDLKPANVKLTSDGRVKVLDFGLAKLAAPDGAQGADHDLLNSPTMTGSASEAGMILGTASYMAPEQAQGKPVDKRADIWAFGALLYEMLTGRRPFPGSSTTEVLAGVLKDAPDWTALPDDVPAGLRHLVSRCLAKNPTQRLRDIGDARLELDHIVAAGGDVPVRQSLRRTLPRWTVWPVSLAAGLAGALLVFALRSSPDGAVSAGTPRRAAIQTTNLGDVRATTFPVALAVDGSLLVYATDDVAGGMLHARQLFSLDAHPIEGTTGALGPFISSDGRLVGFQREGQIFSVPVAGGPVVHAHGSAHLAEGHPAWMPDGRIVYTSPKGGLVSMNADGSSPETLTTPEKGERHLSPFPLPDGRTVLFTAVGGDASHARIDAVSLADRRVRTLVDNGAVTAQYADGHLVYGQLDRQLMAVPFDPSRVELSGAPQALPDRASRSRFGVAHFAVARGVLVYLPLPATHLVEVDRSGRRETLDRLQRVWHHPRYSPDGSHIVVDVATAAGERDVWTFDRSLKTLSRVTRIGDAHDPSWLPDGRSISFLSFKSRGGPLMLAPADGATNPEPVPIGSEFAASDLINPGGWLPDGSAYLCGVADRGGPSDLWRVPRGGSRPVKIVGTPAEEAAPMVSSDGRWVAYQSNETGRVEVYVRGIDGAGGRVQVSNQGGSEPLWDRKSNILYYVEFDGDRLRLIAAALRTSPTLGVLARTVAFSDWRLERAENHANYDIHPDGSRFVIPETTQRGSLAAVFDWSKSVASSTAR